MLLLCCNTARTVFGTNSKTQHHNKKNSNSKPWFTKDCKTKRGAFHGVKNKYKTDKSDETTFLLKEKSKVFKREHHKSFRIYQEKCAGELGSHSKTDTKSFWETLKKFSGNSKRNPPIPIDTFYE